MATKPVLIYGGECWTLDKADEKQFEQHK